MREDHIEGTVRKRYLVDRARKKLQVQNLTAFSKPATLINLEGRDVDCRYLARIYGVGDVGADRGRTATSVENVKSWLQEW